MSTDDQMDDLLRDAGARWRAANPGSARTVDVETARPPARSRRYRWVVMASAAVVVVAVAVGGSWLTTHRTHASTQAVGPDGATTGASEWHGLTNTEWKIFQVTLDPPNSSGTLDATKSSASLHIDGEGAFVADDGINSLSGSVTIDATSLHFGNVATSAVGSTDPAVGAVASAIDSILQGDVTWSINAVGTADDLNIVHPGVGSLTYFGQPPAAVVTDPTKLPGTWQLTSYTQSAGGIGSGAAAAFGDELIVTESGFTVRNRCYSNAGDLAIGTGVATWSKVHLLTATPCPAIPDQQSQQDEQARNSLVDSILTGSTTWQIDGSGQLHITKGSDDIVYTPASS